MLVPLRSAESRHWLSRGRGHATQLCAVSIGAPDQRLPFERSYLPFPKTAAEREQSRDPRKSIAERYTGRPDYMAKFTRPLGDLIRQRWTLPEDRAALLERGAQKWDEATK